MPKEKVVLMGEYAVISAHSKFDALITPGVQSCVAVALHDRQNKVSGLCHIDTHISVYENTINFLKEMRRLGAEIKNIKVELFGGDAPYLGFVTKHCGSNSSVIYDGITEALTEQKVSLQNITHEHYSRHC